MTGRRLKTMLIGAAAVVVVVGIFIFNTTDISNQAVSYRLMVLCADIYNYRLATGHWPSKAADLAGTPMASSLRYWDDDIRTGRVVVVWPRDWPPDRQANAHRILAYYNAGLISLFGWHWVCWGDLRPECLSTRKLQAALQSTGN